MTANETHPLTKRAVSAYVCITASIALVLFLGAWGAYRDLSLVRRSLLEAEVSRVKSHAIRTVGRIEHDLEQGTGAVDLSTYQKDGPIRRHWESMIASRRERHFSAIVNPAGVVVAHRNRKLEGRHLERDWYERVLSDNDSEHDVFETASSALTDGELVYCVRVPIVVNDQTVGEYYAGFSAAWFEATLKQERSEMVRHSALLLAGILVVVVLAVVSLYHIAMHSVGYGRALGLLKLQRSTELEQLAGGLAHEIRNPLQAIRLNVHALARELVGTAKLDRDELDAIVQQTNQEIARVDGLVQQMLGFATPAEPHWAAVDIVEAVRSTQRFVQQELQRSGIEVREDFPQQPVVVYADPDRLRQIMLNLVINAKDELPQGGRIDLQVRQRGKWAEISVRDNGRGIADDDRERIFEPFYSTKDQGSGLGLALVKRFVEEMGGRIWCEANGDTGGTRFRLEIPRDERKGT